MKRPQFDDLFWIGVPLVAIVYNTFFGQDGRTLSEAWDRYLKR
jgi:hypothetical protein